MFPYPHPETITLPTVFPTSRRATNLGVVYPLSYFEMTQDLVRAGMASEEPVRVGEVEVAPIDVMVALLRRERPRLLAEAGVTGPGGCLKVVVGCQGRRPHTYVFSLSSASAGAGEGTGIPAAIGAILALRGQLDGGPGVHATRGDRAGRAHARPRPADVGGLGLSGGGVPLRVEHIGPDGSAEEVPFTLGDRDGLGGSAGRETGSPDDVVFAVDLGTGGPKVGYVSLSGEVLDHEHRRVELQVLPDGGRREPQRMVGRHRERRRPCSRNGPRRTRTRRRRGLHRAVGIDRPGRPVGDAAGECILWLDHRGRDLASEQLGGRLAIEGYGPRAAVEWIRRAGGAPSPEGNDPLGHRLWIQRRSPELYADTAVFLEPIDYLNLRLTGRVAATQATMTLSWLTDNRRLDRVDYDPMLVALAGADADRLPGLVPIRSVVGR